MGGLLLFCQHLHTNMYAIYRWGFTMAEQRRTSDLRSLWSRWARCRTGSQSYRRSVTCLVGSSIILEFQPTGAILLYLETSFDSLCFLSSVFLSSQLHIFGWMEMSSILAKKVRIRWSVQRFSPGSPVGRRWGRRWTEGNESQGRTSTSHHGVAQALRSGLMSNQ